MPKLQIYRDEVLVLEPNTLSADYSGQVMGENKIAAHFILNEAFDFHVNDYIIHRSKRYSIADAPAEMRDANRRFTYDLLFEAPEYKWYNKQFRHLNSGTFSFTGTAVQMLDLLIAIMGPPWLTGEYTETIIKTVQFDKDSCRSALTKIAEAFQLEYEFTETNEVNLIESVGTLVPGVVFKYGKGNGLYNLTRQPVSDNSFGTRFYGYGSSDNLPENYRSGATQLQFTGYYVDTSNIDLDNPIERNADFPDIKPERTGTITAQAIGVNNQWSVTDPSMDFYLNDVIVNGEAKIVFKTGPLSGNEFQITFYDNTTKVITFAVNQEASGYILPNATVHPEIGDTYTFIGITMPTAYVTDAEARLLAATIDFAEKNSTPKISYQLAMDKLFVKANGLTTSLSFGDKIGVQDTAMGVDVVLRIANITYSLFDEAKINATISEEVIYNYAQKVVKAVVNNTNKIITVEEQALRAKNEADNARRTAQIIAGKTNFLTTTIDGNVIATGTLIVGNASGDNNAGISGVEEVPIEDSVRFWAGDTYANRTIAPWRVYQNGRTVMTNATIQSTDSGKRVVISSVDNNITIYDASDDDIIQVDDDSSFEEPVLQLTARLVPDPPNYIGSKFIGPTQYFYYYSLGPGIRVGLGITDVNGVTTIGRQKVFTTGQFVAGADEDDQTIIDKDGLTTTGDVAIGGDLTIEGITPVTDTFRTRIYDDLGAYRTFEVTFVKGFYCGKVDVT